MIYDFKKMRPIGFLQSSIINQKSKIPLQLVARQFRQLRTFTLDERYVPRQFFPF